MQGRAITARPIHSRRPAFGTSTWVRSFTEESSQTERQVFGYCSGKACICRSVHQNGQHWLSRSCADNYERSGGPVSSPRRWFHRSFSSPHEAVGARSSRFLRNKGDWECTGLLWCEQTDKAFALPHLGHAEFDGWRVKPFYHVENCCFDSVIDLPDVVRSLRPGDSSGRQS